MKKRTSFILVLCILLSLFRPACASAETATPSVAVEAADQIAMTLDEYLERGGEDWFLTGKKQYAVQAMMVSKETSFHNELEVVDYTVMDDGVILAEMPDAQKMLGIKGIGQFTVAGFLSEVGDIRRFTDPRQIQKYAGLAIVADNDSGKHEGRTKLSQRGRKRLRWVLFRAALSLVKSNPQFYQLHQYFTGRQGNPLKKIFSNSLLNILQKTLQQKSCWENQESLC